MENLLDDYPDLKFYFVKEDQYKISAAWLIEKIKMKGYQGKDCGVSKKHSLVLVNFSKKSENLVLEGIWWALYSRSCFVLNFLCIGMGFKSILGGFWSILAPPGPRLQVSTTGQ